MMSFRQKVWLVVKSYLLGLMSFRQTAWWCLSDRKCDVWDGQLDVITTHQAVCPFDTCEESLSVFCVASGFTCLKYVVYCILSVIMQPPDYTTHSDTHKTTQHTESHTHTCWLCTQSTHICTCTHTVHRQSHTQSRYNVATALFNVVVECAGTRDYSSSRMHRITGGDGCYYAH